MFGIKRTAKETLGIVERIKNRDFSGNTGLAIKNSIFQFASSVVLKLGSLIFTIIVARMLMPELFGLYSLALSTIVFFAAFSDLGIGTVLIRAISKEFYKKKGNPGAYEKYIFKLKIYLTLFVVSIFLLLSYFIANYYYNKPIFYALIAGCFYIFTTSLMGFYSSIYQSVNKFQFNVYKEVIFQLLRLTLVPLAIFITISKSTEFVLFSIFIALSIAYFVSLIYLILMKPKLTFLKELSVKEKVSLIRFIIPMTTTIVSGVFFGYIDMIILGRFVEAEFIGYYQAALALIGSAGAFIGLSGALFPIFSKLDKKKLEIALKKSRFYTFLISFGAFIATFILSKYIILIVYGSSYGSSIYVLEILAFLLFIDPMIGIYSSYHIALGRVRLIAESLIFSTLLNIILNLVFISYLVNISHYYAILGAAIATIIARVVYLGILVWKRN